MAHLSGLWFSNSSTRAWLIVVLGEGVETMDSADHRVEGNETGQVQQFLWLPTKVTPPPVPSWYPHWRGRARNQLNLEETRPVKHLSPSEVGPNSFLQNSSAKGRQELTHTVLSKPSFYVFGTLRCCLVLYSICLYMLALFSFQDSKFLEGEVLVCSCTPKTW